MAASPHPARHRSASGAGRDIKLQELVSLVGSGSAAPNSLQNVLQTSLISRAGAKSLMASP